MKSKKIIALGLVAAMTIAMVTAKSNHPSRPHSDDIAAIIVDNPNCVA